MVRLAAANGILVAALQRVEYAPRSPSTRGPVEVYEGQASLLRLDARMRILHEQALPGRIVTLCLDRDASRVGLVSRVERHTEVVVLDAAGQRVMHRRFEFNTVFGLAIRGDRVAVGRHLRAWTPQHGPKVELYRGDLMTCVGSLDVNDGGNDVALTDSHVVACGIDVHVWWPDGSHPVFCVRDSKYSPPGEMGSASLSADGRRVAAIHDRMRPTEDAAFVLDVADLEAPPVRIRPAGWNQATRLAMSPDGTRLAMVLDGVDTVLLFRTDDGSEVAQLSTTSPSAVAWLDDNSLAIADATGLSTWQPANR